LPRWSLLLAAAVVAVPAHARTGDCSMPEALKERVCADPDLRKLDAVLVAREREVLTVTARPNTWAGRARNFRNWIATAKDFEDKPADKAALRSHIEQQIEDLDREIVRGKAVPRAVTRAQILGDACLNKVFKFSCSSPSAGIIREGDTVLLWRIESGASQEDGMNAGIMVWDASGAGAPRLIAWNYEAATPGSPGLQSEYGLLMVDGRLSGTGEGNADMLFQKRGDRWVDIDMESWRPALTRRLPDGIDSWHGVEYGFLGPAIGAEADLWKPEDANCCPTGGEANLGFRIEGDTLVLDTVSAQLGGPGTGWKDF
jgi:hypothetical protein